MRRDAYVLTSAWTAATPEERLALRVRAVLAARPSDTASHQSAPALRGLPLHGVALDVVDLIADVSRVRLQSGVRSHVCPSGVAVDLVESYSCLSASDAVAQVLIRSGLLAALVPLDAALHTGRLTLPGLADALDRLCRTPRLRRRGELLMEKRREDALRALGYVVVRVTWADLDHPGRVPAMVRRAMTVLSARDGRLPAS